MCSLCRLWVNFDFWGGSSIGPFLPMTVKSGALEQTERLHLRAKFNLNVFIVSPSGGQKPQFWANFEIGGLLYRLFFTEKMQISKHATYQQLNLNKYVISSWWRHSIPKVIQSTFYKHPIFTVNEPHSAVGVQ